MLTAATGGSAADSCTASLSPLVEGGSECSVSGGGELVNGIRQNVSVVVVVVVCMCDRVCVCVHVCGVSML